MRRLARGVVGAEGLVWCLVFQRNDVVLHVHSSWWNPFGEALMWALEDRDDVAAPRTALLIPDSEDVLAQLASAENWLQVAAVLRSLPVNQSRTG